MELYNTIFTNPNNPDFGLANTDSWKNSYHGVQDLVESDPSTCVEADRCRATVRSILIHGTGDLFLSWLLAAFVPWTQPGARSQSAAGQKPPPPAAAIVVKEGLRADNKVLRVVQGAVIHAGDISSLKEKVTQAQAEGAEMSMGPRRDVLGMAVRRWGQDWRLHAMLALLIELGEVPDTRHGSSAIFPEGGALTDTLKTEAGSLSDSQHFSHDSKTLTCWMRICSNR